MSVAKDRHDHSSLSHAPIFALLVLIGGLLGFVREVWIARDFGLSPALDQFVVALAVITLFSAILSPPTLQGMVMPHYQRLLAESPARAAVFFARTAQMLVGGLLLFICVLWLLAAPLMQIAAPGFDAQAIAHAADYFRLMLPMLLLMAMASVLHAFYNAHRHFVWPLISQLANTLTVIACLWWSTLDSVALLSTYMVLGALVALAMLIWVMRSELAPLSRPSHASVGLDPIWLGWPLLVVALIQQVALLLPRGFASLLENGDVTALNLAFKLAYLPAGIVAMAIATTLFPSLIDSARSDVESAVPHDAFYDGFQWLMYLMLPAMVLMFSEAAPIVRILFEGGNFLAQDVVHTARALVAYAPAIPALALLILLNRLYAAYGVFRQYMWGNLAALALLPVLMWAGMHHAGYMGVAAGFTVYAWVACIGLMIGLRQHLALKWFAQERWRSLVVNGCAGGCIVLLSAPKEYGIVLLGLFYTCLLVVFAALWRDKWFFLQCDTLVQKLRGA